MKKIDIKSILIGFVIGVVSVGTVSATQLSIKSANYNDTKVIYNDEELQLSQPMITVINENSQYGSNYMPVRSILEAMEYEVDWDNATNSVIITDKESDVLDSGVLQISNEEVNEFKSLFEMSDIEFDEDRGFYVRKFIYKDDIKINELQSMLLEKYDMETIDEIIKMLILEPNIKGELIFSFYVKGELDRSVFYYYCMGSNVYTNFVQFRTIN